MTAIGLVIREGVEPAIQLGKELSEWAKAHSYKIIFEQSTASLLGGSQGLEPQKLIQSCDPIVALGGDGTLIGVARYVEKRSPVLLGVNFGRLGFLTEVAPAELFSTLQTVLAGKAEIGERGLILCEVLRDGKVVFSSQGVNDAVIHKGVLDPLMDLDIFIEDENVLRLRADGCIISTPTGSTAYSLSSGGPIVHPSLSVLLVTPICPHLLTVRPLIVSEDSRINITLPTYAGSCFLSVDGQVGFQMTIGDTVRVSKSKHKVKFVRSPSKSYFEILRRKFSWGAGTNEGGPC